MFASCVSLRQSYRLTCRWFGRIEARRFSSQSRQAWTYSIPWEEEPDVESFEEYGLGGYHPVKIADELCESRYSVTHKLGHGISSTVWLARDRIANKNVALKIVAACESEGSSETEMLARIYRNTPRQLGHQFIMSTPREFWINGPNGRHRCLVSEALEPTVATVRRSFDDCLPISKAKQITKQLALGMATIHSCGIVHGGKSCPSLKDLDQTI